ncbi:MAG: hypothetical protein GY944_28790, partial [bacterium]|nr:hypothetical protein [bacterium]
MAVLASGCSLPEDPLAIETQHVIAGESHFTLRLARGYLPGSLGVQLDGRHVEMALDRHSLFGGVVPLLFEASGGRHVASVRARFVTPGGIVTRTKRFSFFVHTFLRSDLPSLVSSWPMEGTHDLAVGEWIQLEFSARPDEAMLESFRLECGGREIAFAVHRTRPTFIVLNPRPQLPSRSDCLFSWSEQGRGRRFVFSTAPKGPPAWIQYDREQRGLSSPFPDDYFMARDPGRATGLKIALERSSESSALDRFADRLASDLESLDGWSPVGHLFLALSDAVDPVSLPQTAEESVHPASALQLLDVDPHSPSFAERLPFVAEPREDRDASGQLQHSLLVHPLLPARPGGRYALIATRALRADATRPFEPSSFMRRVLDGPSLRDSPALRRARDRAWSAVWIAEHLVSPPVPREDMALAFRFTAGTLPGLAQDLLRVRRQLGVRPSPDCSIDRVEEEPGVVEAVATGIWRAPRWRNGDNFARGAGGRPVIEGTKPVPFTLALPRDRPPLG